jgi:hypothetical protein
LSDQFIVVFLFTLTTKKSFVNAHNLHLNFEYKNLVVDLQSRKLIALELTFNAIARSQLWALGTPFIIIDGQRVQAIALTLTSLVDLRCLRSQNSLKWLKASKTARLEVKPQP